MTGAGATGALDCGVAGVALPGIAGADFAGAGAFTCSSTLPEVAAPRVAMIDNVIDVSMNMAADIVVAFESNVAEPRGPNAVCDPIPPNAPARSAAWPLWSNTTTVRKIQTITWITVIK